MNQEHNHCLICNSRNITELTKFNKSYLVQCCDCGFIFCKKIPTTAELINHYKSYPREENISNITIKRYNQILDFFESYRKTNNILDIGCGNGHFLEVAKKRGWNVHGTEFTDEAMEICVNKKIEMQQGVLNPENYYSIKFDIVVSFEVIEHINNPKTEIQNIINILDTNGLFYFTTPNFNSISRFILKDKWSVIEYPEHLSYYTSKTMHRFLSKQGFKKIKIETTGFSFNRLQRDSAHLQKEIKNSNKDEELREKTETSWLFKTIKNGINFILNSFKIGDSLKGVYQKT